ncbi:hypothetical protein DM39_4091 [Burkholderia cenocepacia]|uniref:Protein TonB n=1 Tax=Burkholderia cenocepacia TaxID=95486 RepID=A0AAN0VQF2_9BURK|nr:hypothetical protein DM39_4091 [Burkholderia cenocepacia]
MLTEPVFTSIAPGQPRQYAHRRSRTVRRYAGMAVVLMLHVLFIWALMNGLANKVVQVVQKPIETKIITRVKPQPSPPTATRAPTPAVQPRPPKTAPRKIAAPPPSVVLSPEVPVVPAPAPAIARPTPGPAPVAPPTVAAPPTKPVSHQVGVVCPNSDEIRRSMAYPVEAQENNITGDVLISFTVDPQGHVSNEKVEQSADTLLDQAAYDAVKKFNCVSQGQSVRVQVPFSFNLN